ncbi:Hypothetical predicted protein [Octopus vulgaris]|nr:Hypothetical predicted protein [Octopus vulgaris]
MCGGSPAAALLLRLHFLRGGGVSCYIKESPNETWSIFFSKTFTTSLPQLIFSFLTLRQSTNTSPPSPSPPLLTTAAATAAIPQNSIMQKFLVVMIIAAILACVSTFQSVEARQDEVTEIIGLASKILEIAIHMDKPRGLSKRNHGMIDTLINIPDLDKVGRK